MINLRSTTSLFPVVSIALCALFSAPSTTQAQSIGTKLGCLAQPRLVCNLRGTSNRRQVRGVVQFAPRWWGDRKVGRKCGTLIRAQVTGLKPFNTHGFHIHTYGDVRREDGKLAGGHFANPYGIAVPHGYPSDKKRHWGDLGNLISWKGGNAGYSAMDYMIRLSGIVGRAIIVHESADQGPEAQPSGDAGKRIAQCVIGYANPDGAVFD